MKNKKGIIAAVIFTVIFMVGFWMKPKHVPYQKNEGNIFGTIYHITYQYSQNLQDSILLELNRFDASLSPFNQESIITRVNNNDSSVVADRFFTTVFNRSKEIYESTGGAFDPTISPLINAWGFGFKKGEDVTPGEVDSLLQFCGFHKVALKDNRVIKADSRMTFNFSAIAKGFSCDVVASYLMEKGITNFMVEIGGEVVAHGVNELGQCWRIGINKPIENNSADAGEIEKIIDLCDAGMATSGNYRNFYYKDGKRIAHTIDPRTGYPVEHSLLSATVLAKDCMTADAYATAFMVLGLEKSREIVENDPDIEAVFIYMDEAGKDSVYMTPGIEKYTVGPQKK